MALLEGLDEGVLADIASGLPLTPGIEALCAGLKAAGCQIALLSGGFTYFAEHVQGILGIDHVRANRLELIDGKLTGRHLGPIVDGAAKEAALIELTGAHDIPLSATMAVGDGANDLQMLARSGFGVAFHAKPVVAAEADHAISSLGLDCLLPVLGIERP
jgi:phosphoserine phosphatase